MITKGQLLRGRYRLISLIGEGGMAFVYKAHDEELNRTVAIKALRPEFSATDAFRQEARASAGLPHPNIVAVFDVGQEGNDQYIVMEYVEGQSLKELIQLEAPFRVSRAVSVVSQICKAVSFAHQKGIIHCDLKPQNVLVLPNGQVKVTDFGIARASAPGMSPPAGKLWGTPHYASPEMLTGQELTPASDVYAIGVILYELLTGQLPFSGLDAAEITRQHVLSMPPPVQTYNPRVPRYLQQIIDRALSKDPATRYRSASQLDSVLVAYRQHGAAITQPIEPTPLPRESAQAEPAAPGPLVPASRPLSAADIRPGIDWLMLILLGLAFVAIMGLLPLWGTVISRALGGPLPMPFATPTQPAVGATPTFTLPATRSPDEPTLTPIIQVAVPDLVGKSLEEARETASTRGLVLMVAGEQHDSVTPKDHIVAQSIPASSQVPRGAELGVTVSLGPQMVVLPSLVGFPASVKQLDLEDLGLAVVLTETWSTEPIGLILDQEPAEGAEVQVGGTVTLTVSSGPLGRIEASFGDAVTLKTCELNAQRFHPGDALQVILTWQVQQRLSKAYTIFIHVTDSRNQILVQLDRPPLGGSRPTDTWQPGELLLDPYVLSLPGNAPPGKYRIHLGLYEGNARLPVTDPGFSDAQDDAIAVGEIDILSN